MPPAGHRGPAEVSQLVTSDYRGRDRNRDRELLAPCPDQRPRQKGNRPSGQDHRWQNDDLHDDGSAQHTDRDSGRHSVQRGQY